ncbi:ROK family protein, partial [Lactobacillus crispatus]
LIENLPMLLIQIKSKLPILEATQTQLQIARQTKFAPLLGGYSLLVRKIFDLGAKRLRLIP